MLTKLTTAVTDLNQVFVLAVVTGDEILQSHVEEIHVDLNKFLFWILEQIEDRFSSFHPFNLYKIFMIFWHGLAVIGMFAGFQFQLQTEFAYSKDIVLGFERCFTLICQKILSDNDWRYLDLFLYGSIFLLLNKHNVKPINQISEILQILDKKLNAHEVIDAHTYLMNRNFCCENNKHGQENWTSHLYAGILLLTFVKIFN